MINENKKRLAARRDIMKFGYNTGYGQDSLLLFNEFDQLVFEKKYTKVRDVLDIFDEFYNFCKKGERNLMSGDIVYLKSRIDLEEYKNEKSFDEIIFKLRKNGKEIKSIGIFGKVFLFLAKLSHKTKQIN